MHADAYPFRKYKIKQEKGRHEFLTPDELKKLGLAGGYHADGQPSTQQGTGTAVQGAYSLSGLFLQREMGDVYKRQTVPLAASTRERWQ